MICPKCKKEGAIITVDSRPDYDEPRVWRRKRCVFCGYRFTTVEVVAKLHGTGRQSEWAVLGLQIRRRIDG